MSSVVVRYIGFAISFVGLVLSLWLGSICHTSEGLIFALAGLSLAVSILFSCIAVERPSRSWRWCGFVAFTIFCGLTITLLVKAPDGRTNSESRIQHRYVDDAWHFRRFAFGNLLPEIDQFRFGFQIVPAVDRLFTQQQAGHLSGLTTAIYDKLESDPEFHALGSVMPEAYDELWGLDFDHGHYFLYVPSGLDRNTPHPAIVFLHGSGGNFKAYAWLLAKVADKLGMVVIAPSFGLGNWHEPHSSRVVRLAISDASRLVKLDTPQLHLMGLSNGGLGTSQCGATLGAEFKTLTFLSPVFDLSAITAATFESHWRGRGVLIISGTADDRVPFGYVSESAMQMKSAGISVTMHAVANADHFMLFSHEAEVLGEIEAWMRRHTVIP